VNDFDVEISLKNVDFRQFRCESQEYIVLILGIFLNHFISSDWRVDNVIATVLQIILADLSILCQVWPIQYDYFRVKLLPKRSIVNLLDCDAPTNAIIISLYL
jgi:hypothetical protein